MMPGQSAALTILRGFLQSILPSGVEIVQGQQNRTPEPQSADFVVMTPLRNDRISTNMDTYADCAFTGSISGTVLTVTAMLLGTITLGNLLFGTNVAANTNILTQISGTPGGAGTYSINQSQNVSSEILACGTEDFLQPVNFQVQLDVHGPNSADNAVTISTLFRDDYSYEAFLAASGNANGAVTPLYADDPRQMPFINAEAEYEWRWVIEAQIEVNALTILPLQFAQSLSITLIQEP